MTTEELCEKYNINNYTINDDGSIDVDGNVYFYSGGEKLTELPLKFGHVTGDFECEDHRLTTLEGSPIGVGRSFIVSRNLLTNLKGSPKQVGFNFACSHNQLTTLEGGPEYVDTNFYCLYNNLTDLKGAPKFVGHFFNCSNNEIYSLDGFETKRYVQIFFEYNPIYYVLHKGQFEDGYSEEFIVSFMKFKIIKPTDKGFSVHIKRLKYLNSFSDTLDISPEAIKHYYSIV